MTEMLAHPLVVDPDHVAKPTPFAIHFHGGSLSVWLRRSSRNANLTRAGATAQICERFFTSSTQNAFIESLNGRLRDEFPNETLSTLLIDARVVLEDWRRDYNHASEHPSVYVIEENRFC
jgi:transposase InsO family protein